MIGVYTLVSIPFKRESISKGWARRPRAHSISWVSIPFKRESISKGTYYYYFGNVGRVSIPFKRESISKGNPVARKYQFYLRSVSIPFKRESISKAGPAIHAANDILQVSIPFKRESISKVAMERYREARMFRFNSLQTGKHIQSNENISSGRRFRVSIPFKRESISKGQSSNACRIMKIFRFNSLQTGKHIQR